MESLKIGDGLEKSEEKTRCQEQCPVVDSPNTSRKARVEMVSNVNTKWSAGQRSPYLLAVQATDSVAFKGSNSF